MLYFIPSPGREAFSTFIRVNLYFLFEIHQSCFPRNVQTPIEGTARRNVNYRKVSNFRKDNGLLQL